MSHVRNPQPGMGFEIWTWGTHSISVRANTQPWEAGHSQSMTQLLGLREHTEWDGRGLAVQGKLAAP